ncbi:transcription initiation factor TFIID subunit 11, partial [Brachionus plicatilis]
ALARRKKTNNSKKINHQAKFFYKQKNKNKGIVPLGSSERRSAFFSASLYGYFFIVPNILKMEESFEDDEVYGMMDPVDLKQKKEAKQEENVNTEPKKKIAEGEEEADEEEEGKYEENKDESFDISSSESDAEEEENFDLFEKLKTEKEPKTDAEKTEDKQTQEVLPGPSKPAEVSDKKKRLSMDTSALELAKKKKIEQIEEENKKMQVLMANFSEEQLNRYETFRRSAFQKSSIKKIIQTVCGKSVSQSVVIAMSGISKVFVGEIVEKALDVKEKWGDSGPLQPKHLREAFRLFKNSNRLSDSIKHKKPSLF